MILGGVDQSPNLSVNGVNNNEKVHQKRGMSAWVSLWNATLCIPKGTPYSYLAVVWKVKGWHLCSSFSFVHLAKLHFVWLHKYRPETMIFISPTASLMELSLFASLPKGDVSHFKIKRESHTVPSLAVQKVCICSSLFSLICSKSSETWSNQAFACCIWRMHINH